MISGLSFLIGLCIITAIVWCCVFLIMSGRV